MSLFINGEHEEETLIKALGQTRHRVPDHFKYELGGGILLRPHMLNNCESLLSPSPLLRKYLSEIFPPSFQMDALQVAPWRSAPWGGTIWMIDREDKYYRLIADNAINPILLPDGKRLVIQTLPKGISVLRLQLGQSRAKTFSINLKTVSGIKVGLVGYVMPPKINPLNGKVVGYEEGLIKGAVRVLSIKEKSAVVQINLDVGTVIKANDVVVLEREFGETSASVLHMQRE